MGELLLDTITFDFLLRDPLKIPIKSRVAIEQADTVFVSVVSLWELSNHIREGKFTLSIDYELYFRRALRTHSLTLLPIQWEALEYMGSFAYQYLEMKVLPLADPCSTRGFSYLNLPLSVWRILKK